MLSPSAGQPNPGSSPLPSGGPSNPPGSSTLAPTTVPFTLGNTVIHKLVKKNTVRAKTVLSKYDRCQLDQNEKMKLFNNIVKRQPMGAFKSLPNNITEPKQLDEFQHLDIMIENTCSHFQHYDVADVFSIVFPDSNGNLLAYSSGNVKMVNLFSHFTELTVAQVAASNRWHCEFTDDSMDQFHTNLDWTHAFFVNNIEPSLYTIVNDNQKRYAQEE
jgi:hypothetical protein